MKVSVVIPTYNRAHYITFAIDSVLKQNYANLEIIVVDDGSTDGTAGILHSQFKDRLRYIYQENQGFAVARNRGVETAAGDYIAFLDSDDIWNEGKIELQVAIMDSYPSTTFLFSDFTILKESGEEINNGLDTWFSQPVDWLKVLPDPVSYVHNQKNISKSEYSLYFGNLYHSLLSTPYILPSTAVVRKTAIPTGVQHTEGDPYCADWDFFALLSKDNGQACYLQHETTINRSHTDSVRSTQSLTLMEKMQYRLTSINRIWKSDEKFMRRYFKDTEIAESDLLLKLAKQSFRLHRIEDVRDYLKKWKSKENRQGKFMALMLSLLVRIPGSIKLLTFLR